MGVTLRGPARLIAASNCSFGQVRARGRIPRLDHRDVKGARSGRLHRGPRWHCWRLKNPASSPEINGRAPCKPERPKRRENIEVRTVELQAVINRLPAHLCRKGRRETGTKVNPQPGSGPLTGQGLGGWLLTINQCATLPARRAAPTGEPIGAERIRDWSNDTLPGDCSSSKIHLDAEIGVARE